MTSWLRQSLHGAAGASPKASPATTSRADRGQAGQVPLCLRPLCRTRVAHRAGRYRRCRDARTRSRARSSPRATARPNCSTFRSSTRNAGRSPSRGRRRATCSASTSTRSSRAGRSRSARRRLIPEFGGLVATANTALLNAPLPERVKKMEVTEQGIKFNARSRCPTSHSSARSACQPEIEAITSLQPDY